MPIFQLSVVIIVMLVLTSFSNASHADNKLLLVRDAQVEEVLLKLAKPIFRVAGLNDNIRIFIINSQGSRVLILDKDCILIHMGLLADAAGPEAIMSIIAHEVAHIAHGHVAKYYEELMNTYKNRFTTAVMSSLLSALISESATAVSTIVQDTQITNAKILGYSRIQEQIADRLAVQYLLKLGINLSSIINLMVDPEEQYRIACNNCNSAHQLSNKREQHLKNEKLDVKHHINRTKNSRILTPEIRAEYDLAIAKLRGSVWALHKLTSYYNETASPEYLYAIAVTQYKEHNIYSAMAKANQLIKLRPHDPYSLELKAQFLYQLGDIASAIEYFRQASQLKSDSALLKLELADAIILDSMEYDTKKVNEAIAILNGIKSTNPTEVLIWKQLGTAYRKIGKDVHSCIALAHAEILLHNHERAAKLLNHAEITLSKDSQDFDNLSKEINNLKLSM